MTLEIRTHQLALHPILRTKIEERILWSLGRFADRTAKVCVKLADINGPRGGVDKHCRIEVTVRGQRPLTVEDYDAEILPVVGKATERLRRALARAFQRTRVFRRSWMSDRKD
ncbi:MAG: hypothetical protein U0V87_13280 [Acidobacteriota bacterium]